MDVFSLGCTIAEVLMDGKPLFSLSTLLSYQRGDIREGKRYLSCWEEVFGDKEERWWDHE